MTFAFSLHPSYLTYRSALPPPPPMVATFPASSQQGPGNYFQSNRGRGGHLRTLYRAGTSRTGGESHLAPVTNEIGPPPSYPMYEHHQGLCHAPPPHKGPMFPVPMNLPMMMAPHSLYTASLPGTSHPHSVESHSVSPIEGASLAAATSMPGMVLPPFQGIAHPPSLPLISPSATLPRTTSKEHRKSTPRLAHHNTPYLSSTPFCHQIHNQMPTPSTTELCTKESNRTAPAMATTDLENMAPQQTSSDKTDTTVPAIVASATPSAADSMPEESATTVLHAPPSSPALGTDRPVPSVATTSEPTSVISAALSTLPPAHFGPAAASWPSGPPSSAPRPRPLTNPMAMKSPITMCFERMLGAAELLAGGQEDGESRLPAKRKSTYQPLETDLERPRRRVRLLSDESEEKCEQESETLPSEQSHGQLGQEVTTKLEDCKRLFADERTPEVPTVPFFPHEEYALSVLNPFKAIEEDEELQSRVLVEMTLQRPGCEEATSYHRPSATTTSSPSSLVIADGFFWRDYPACEKVLYDHMNAYYQTAFSSRSGKEQQAFNQSLVEAVHKAARAAGYQIAESFGDKQLRDRIRCFYKTHLQNAKKRLATMQKHPESLENQSILRVYIRAIKLNISYEQSLFMEPDLPKRRGRAGKLERAKHQRQCKSASCTDPPESGKMTEPLPAPTVDHVSPD